VRLAAAIPWLLAAPAAATLLLFLLGPSAAVIVMSFTDWELGAPELRFVGLDNYAEMLEDRVFRISLGNTLLYAAIVVPAAVGLGLAAALLIHAAPRGRTLFRAVYFLPAMATIVAMAVVFEFMLHPTLGVVNLMLKAVGLPARNWLGEAETVIAALAVIGVWEAVGFNMVLFLAALAALPRDLYEAAEVDGVPGAFERFRTVTWPLLGPTTLFVLVITTLRAFRVFDTVAAITQGNPGRASEVLLYTIYREGLVFFRVGYASALTVVFLIGLMAVALLQTRGLDRRVHYA